MLKQASAPEYPKYRWLRRLGPPIFLLMIAALLYSGGYRVEDLSHRLKETGAWAPLLFAVSGVISMSMMIPKTWVSLAAGALLGTPLGCATMLMTAVTAAALNYCIGWLWLGDTVHGPSPTSDSRGESGGESSESLLVTFKRLAREAGFGTHFLVRLSPIPTSVISYSMGAAGARMKPYLAAAALGVVPQWLYVHAAALAADSQASDQYRQASFVISLSIAVLVSIALPKIAMKRWKESQMRNVVES